eukprot:7141841-Pyramimonas_sp.AAC.2
MFIRLGIYRVKSQSQVDAPSVTLESEIWTRFPPFSHLFSVQRVHQALGFVWKKTTLPSREARWSVSPRWAAGVPGEPCDHESLFGQRLTTIA